MRKADKKKLMDSKLKCSFVEEDISEQVCEAHLPFSQLPFLSLSHFQPSSSSKADTISASSFESSEHVLAPDNKSSEASLDNVRNERERDARLICIIYFFQTPVTTITPSEQPTAGSTPGHNTGRQVCHWLPLCLFTL